MTTGTALDHVPEITDPLGNYWDQPPREDILMDNETAVVTRKTFELLHNYSHSWPTGTYSGKMWRRVVIAGGSAIDWLVFYGAVQGKEIEIKYRRLLIV